MSRLFVYLIVLLIFSHPLPSFAQEGKKHTPKNKTPEEIIRYVQQAVTFIQERGEDSYSELTDPNGPWVENDFYIFVCNFKGYIVAHLNKNMVGNNMYGIRDMKGNAFFARFQEIVRSKKGNGWTEYWWPKPNSTLPVRKLGFVQRVPGKELWVGTGIYDMKKEEVDRILDK